MSFHQKFNYPALPNKLADIINARKQGDMIMSKYLQYICVKNGISEKTFIDTHNIGYEVESWDGFTIWLNYDFEIDKSNITPIEFIHGPKNPNVITLSFMIYTSNSVEQYCSINYGTYQTNVNVNNNGTRVIIENVQRGCSLIISCDGYDTIKLDNIGADSEYTDFNLGNLTLQETNTSPIEVKIRINATNSGGHPIEPQHTIVIRYSVNCNYDVSIDDYLDRMYYPDISNSQPSDTLENETYYERFDKQSFNKNTGCYLSLLIEDNDESGSILDMDNTINVYNVKNIGFGQSEINYINENKILFHQALFLNGTTIEPSCTPEIHISVSLRSKKDIE